MVIGLSMGTSCAAIGPLKDKFRVAMIVDYTAVNGVFVCKLISISNVCSTFFNFFLF